MTGTSNRRETTMSDTETIKPDDSLVRWIVGHILSQPVLEVEAATQRVAKTLGKIGFDACVKEGDDPVRAEIIAAKDTATIMEAVSAALATYIPADGGMTEPRILVSKARAIGEHCVDGEDRAHGNSGRCADHAAMGARPTTIAVAE